MSKWIKLTIFLLLVVLFGNCTSSAQEKESLTLEELMSNVKAACDTIEDASITAVYESEGKDEIVTTYLYKRPYQTLTKMMDGKMMILSKMEDDKYFTYSYFKGSKKITRFEVKLDSIDGYGELGNKSEFVPILGQSLALFKRAITKKLPITLEKMEGGGKEFWRVSVDDKSDTVNKKYVYDINSSNWVVSKIEAYLDGQLQFTQIVTKVVINSGLTDENFDLGAPEDAKVVDNSVGMVSSVEIIKVGKVTPDSIVNVDKDQCPTCSESALCNYLKVPEAVVETETIPAILKTGFGFSFKAKFESDSKFSMVKIRYIYPPMTDPNTGEARSQEEHLKMAIPGEMDVVGWKFDFERELNVGEWTIQILDPLGKKVLAEKKFNVVLADDIYKYMPDQGKRILQIKRHIKENPKDAMAVKNLGNVYLDLKDYDQAIALYEKALTIKPHPNFYNNLCLASNEKKEYDRALDYCNEAVKMNLGHTSALINRGNAYRFKGEYDKAIADFTKSLEVAPKGDHYNPPFAYSGRALVYMAKENYEVAIADFTQQLKYDPNDKTVYMWRSRAYKALGEIEKAKQDWERATQE